MIDFRPMAVSRYSERVKSTFHIFETWARDETQIEYWTKVLDIDNQADLKVFAKYQSYVIKIFRLVERLPKGLRRRFLKENANARLAERWLIWSNTCFKYEFCP